MTKNNIENQTQFGAWERWIPLVGIKKEANGVDNPNCTYRENIGSWAWTLYQTGCLAGLAYLIGK